MAMIMLGGAALTATTVVLRALIYPNLTLLQMRAWWGPFILGFAITVEAGLRLQAGIKHHRWTESELWSVRKNTSSWQWTTLWAVSIALYFALTFSASRPYRAFAWAAFLIGMTLNLIRSCARAQEHNRPPDFTAAPEYAIHPSGLAQDQSLTKNPTSPK